MVKDLKVGELLVQSDGNTLKIDSIELVQKYVTVYNMTVYDFHTYFVSDLAIWVHNTNCTWVPGFKPLGKGSTGRTTPASHTELKAMQKAVSDPTKGTVLKMPSLMQDRRRNHADGWVKMSRKINGVEIHWVYNVKTRQYDDFKFKDR
nr:polymorphic toxin-type HINT domain-containing protein [Paenibacillus xylanexedens]